MLVLAWCSTQSQGVGPSNCRGVRHTPHSQPPTHRPLPRRPCLGRYGYVNQEEDQMRGRIASLTGIAFGAATLSLVAPAMAAPAGVSAHPAARGTEHFQLLGTRTTSRTGPVMPSAALPAAAPVNPLVKPAAKS